MEKIQITAKFKIHEGKVEDFKKIVGECVIKVKENEQGKGALQYDWFFSPDQTECVVREAYIDSNAVMTHMGNVGELLGQLFSISEFNLEVYGNPSEELQQAASSLNPKVFSFYNGL